MPDLTSNELNFLVFRYLMESGFTHSAFTLGYEAGINNSTIDGNLVPPGALVTFVQKGLQYLELEANVNNSEIDMDDEDLSFLQTKDLAKKGFNELMQIVKEKKENLRKERGKNKEKDIEGEQRGHKRERERQEIDKERERDREKIEKQHKERVDKELGRDRTEPMDISPSTPTLACEIPNSDVTILEGHASEVLSCAWSPAGSLLASGSGDATARIWTIVDGPCSSSMQSGPSGVLVLKHLKGRNIEKNKDVTTLDWNREGTLLATGSYDGLARIWSKYGELRKTLNKHKGPIFSLKWNKRGDYLLSGSVDKTAIVWDVKKGEWKQQFEFHSGPTLDVDWRNNVSFATCSIDNMIYVCKVGENRPTKTFSGHQDEVNAIKWDPTGSLLASCSDDLTAKIWSLKQDKCVHDLKEHIKAIYTIRWSPTGPGTSNPNQQLVLASASFDSTIKLWDVERGSLLHSLNGHREPVYSVAFSPNGEYLASGSLDRCVHIWSMREGKVVKMYRGNGGIFEVCWNKKGDKIAACFADSTVCILDFRIL